MPVSVESNRGIQAFLLLTLVLGIVLIGLGLRELAAAAGPRHAFFMSLPFGSDFTNFWMGGRLSLSGETALLFDYDAYNARIASLFPPRERGDVQLIFSYPPHILPFLMPLGLLPHAPALILFTAINAAALLLALRTIAPQSPPFAFIALLAAPITWSIVVYGHPTGILGLLAAIALAMAHNRPWLSGLALALLSVKPQFAMILGLALLLAGFWRPLIFAALFGVILAGLPLLLIDADLWMRFLNWTAPQHAKLLQNFIPQAFQTSLAAYTSFRLMGLSYGPAMLGQAVISLIGLAAAVLCLRGLRHDGWSGPRPARAMAACLLGCLLALPYFNAYDLPVLIVAYVGFVFARDERESLVGPADLAIHACFWLLPWLTPALSGFGLPALTGLMLLVLVWLAHGFLKRGMVEPARAHMQVSA